MLDINTPKGQESLSHEQEMIAIVTKVAKGCRLIQTPKWKASDIDGMIVKGDQIIGLFESKCRDMTRSQLTSFGNEWLVTFEKIQKGAMLAKSLCVPFIGYLFLIPDKTVLSIRLTDEHGNLLPKIRLERTPTQATCNGGEAVRTNAYISMAGALEFK